MFFWKWTVRVGHKLSARFGFMSPNSMDQNYPTLALIRLIDGSKDVPWMSWVKRSRSGVQNRSRSVSVLPHETSWSRKAGSFLTAVLQNACWNSLKAMPMREGGGGGHSKKEKCLKLRLIGQSRMRACSSQLHAHTAWSLIRWGVRWALRRPAVWTPLFTLAGLVRLTVSTVQLGGISSRLKSSILNNANSTTGGGEAAAGCAGGTGLSVWWVLCAARCNLVIYCSTATL